MRLGARILRFLFPKQEKERMEVREMMSINRATAEDLVKTFTKLDGEVIKKMLNGHDHGRGNH